MSLMLAALVFVPLALALWLSYNPPAPPPPSGSAAPSSLSSHGQDLRASHGKQLKEQVQGGTKCPHCGKPI